MRLRWGEELRKLRTWRPSDRARKFAREVGGIVLGVLIALALGEVADDVRWRVRAADGEAAIDGELALAAAVFDERSMLQPCLQRRIADVKARLDEAWRTGLLPDIPAFGGVSERPLRTAAWTDAVSSGTLPHLPAASRELFALNYPIIEGYTAAVIRENELWSALHVVIDRPGRVPPQMLADASTTLYMLYAQSSRNSVNAAQVSEDLARRGIRPDYSIILDRRGTRGEVLAKIRASLTCEPLERLIASRAAVDRPGR